MHPESRKGEKELTDGTTHADLDENSQTRSLSIRSTLVPLISRLLPQPRRPARKDDRSCEAKVRIDVSGERSLAHLAFRA